MVDASERLQVLLRQEESIYKTSDYLTRMHSKLQQQKILDTDPAATTSKTSFATPASGDGSVSSSPKKRKSSWEEEVEQGVQSPSTVHQCDRTTGSVGSEASSSTQINKHWREKICEWAYQVVDHFDLNREVVSIAMSHLDRFLDAFSEDVDKNLFQLLAMTCLYLSIKLNEYKHLLIPGSKSSMDTILKLSRGVFTLKQMEEMEYEILQRLRWHVHPPTPQVFVKHFLFFLSVEEHEVHDLTQFMIELSAMDYFFVSYKPSDVAVASLLNALDHLYPRSATQVHLSFLSQFIDIYSPRVFACRERLALIYSQANDQGNGLDGSNPDKSTLSGTVEPAPLRRTTSPVSVMAAPQPCSSYSYGSTSNQSDGMEMEYLLDEDEEENYDDL